MIITELKIVYISHLNIRRNVLFKSNILQLFLFFNLLCFVKISVLRFSLFSTTNNQRQYTIKNILIINGNIDVYLFNLPTATAF